MVNCSLRYQLRHLPLLVGRVGLEPTTHGTKSEVTIICTVQVYFIVKAIGRKGEKSNIMCSIQLSYKATEATLTRLELATTRLTGEGTLFYTVR